MQIVSPKVPVDYMQGALWLAFVCHGGQPSVLFFLPVPFIFHGLGLQH